jgi:hypothetical protein
MKKTLRQLLGIEEHPDQAAALQVGCTVEHYIPQGLADCTEIVTAG